MADQLHESFVKEVENDFPQWEEEARGVRVHDWRNHVGEHVRKIWITLPGDVRLAIALDAQYLANQEEWE